MGVTWVNQPATTTQNQVTLPASTFSNQDYLNINVTSLVQDMIDNPLSSFGFMLQLQTEQFYRSLVFASSDHNNAFLHPKLNVCYTASTGIKDEGNAIEEITLFPNPVTDKLTLELHISVPEDVTIDLYNALGQKIKVLHSGMISPGKWNETFDVSDITNGVYLISVSGITTTSKRFVKL
jgi:hypothetical protein